MYQVTDSVTFMITFIWIENKYTIIALIKPDIIEARQIK